MIKTYVYMHTYSQAVWPTTIYKTYENIKVPIYIYIYNSFQKIYFPKMYDFLNYENIFLLF